MQLTEAQRKRLQDYAPTNLYTHPDGSPVVFIWERDRVEVHRITPSGEVWTSTRAFDEDEDWQHDVIRVDIEPAEIPGFEGTRAALDSLGKQDTKPCDHCGVPIDSDIHTEELGMCLDCSNKYWGHEGEDQ